MPSRRLELGIAKGLGSSSEKERMDAISAFAGLIVMSAPTALGLLAAQHPEVCNAYSGDQPLPQYLLDRLPIPDDLLLAWRIALLHGDGLSRALESFDKLHGPHVRVRLARHHRASDDAYQQVMVALLTHQEFREAFFGNFAGRGSLVSFVGCVFLREAARLGRIKENRSNIAPCLEDSLQATGDGPVASAERRELQVMIAEVLIALADDAGFVPFLLQACLDIRPKDLAMALRLGEEALRQKTFRFRARCQELWEKRHPSEPFPLG